MAIFAIAGCYSPAATKSVDGPEGTPKPTPLPTTNPHTTNPWGSFESHEAPWNSRLDYESPPGAYLESLDDVTGRVFRLHVNCLDGVQLWSLLAEMTKDPFLDERMRGGRRGDNGTFAPQISIEIDGDLLEPPSWRYGWSGSGYSGASIQQGFGGREEGPKSILYFEDTHEATPWFLDEMFSRDAERLVFDIPGEPYNARPVFDVTGFQEALTPIMDNCRIDYAPRTPTPAR